MCLCCPRSSRQRKSCRERLSKPRQGALQHSEAPLKQRVQSDGFNVFSSHFFSLQGADVHNKPWYASTCDRKTADNVLLRTNKVRALASTTRSGWNTSHNPLQDLTVSALLQDGAFMVRKSSGQDALQPYTLVVFYKARVYNIPVRLIPTTQQYALGREKKGEEVRRWTFSQLRSIWLSLLKHVQSGITRPGDSAVFHLTPPQTDGKDFTPVCKIRPAGFVPCFVGGGVICKI